jgi:hypothetical protein
MLKIPHRENGGNFSGRCLYQITTEERRVMDAKTLEKMTVVKLREEAMKFDDIAGVHGMHKDELVSVLKEKFGIVEDKTASELLIEQKHAIKKKIQQLKVEKDQAIEAKDEKKTALVRRRLRRQRRLLKKVLTKAAA